MFAFDGLHQGYEARAELRREARVRFNITRGCLNAREWGERGSWMLSTGIESGSKRLNPAKGRVQNGCAI